ncbi:MAG: methylenetetrahydrofolate reductase [Candidatus Thermoplasmatota archaeon]|nr:methylenetetrahydrofolate reductase [Candidatus Thermoplasmatota archaeon]
MNAANNLEKRMNAGSNLEKILSQGHFAVTTELGPPKGADGDKVRAKGEILRNCSDAVNITDNQTAIARLSSMAAGAILHGMGVEPVVQLTTRDRNRLALQSDILGGASLGIKNILCLTGDHQSFGNHPQARGVYDIDSIQFIRMCKGLRDEGVFLSGDKLLSAKPQLFIGGVVNPFTDPPEASLIRLEKKIDAGADFIQTQAIFNVPRFAVWLDEVRDAGLDKKTCILAGISPVKSPKIARRMMEVIPGMDVPEDFVQRMEKAQDPMEEGFNASLEILEELKVLKGIRGIHIMAILWESMVPQLAKEAGLLPRPRP